MTSTVSPVRSKFTWGRRIATALIAALVFSVTTAEAQGQHQGRQGQQQRAPRERGKLDPRADKIANKTTGSSNVIIEFNDESAAASLISSHNGKMGRRLGILQARSGRIPNRMLRHLANDPRVKRVSIDRDVDGMVGRTAVATGARAVQELMGYTGAGVGVAIVDSGVTAWHDDLTIANGQGQRVTHFVDFVNGLTTPYDDWGHGTHVAGIVGGNGYDTNGVRTSIAPQANIIALKALDNQGHSTISTIIAAIDYAVAHQAEFNIRVLNLSLGAGVYESYETDPLTLACKRAVDAGIVVVAAAGNLGKAANGEPQYGGITAPGNAPWVITVGASSSNGTVRRQDDTMASFSSRGPTMHDYLAKPDVVAPGMGIVSLADPLSTFATTKAQYLLPGFISTPQLPYLSLSGTSMAAPVVSGTVALMLQANPNLTPNLVKAIIQFTAQEYPGYNALTQGTGFLNTRGAVVLSEYFHNAVVGSPYPNMRGWSRSIIWANHRVNGGVLTPGGTAWGGNVVWGAADANGDNIVWGDNCADPNCDNVVWGNNIVWGDSADDNIVWGNADDDNIVWGNADGDNIVWGNGDDDNIVWGNADDDNVVWGNDCGGADCDNVVWGNDTGDADNVVWGNAAEDDNIVWGNATSDDNIVWGNSDDDNIVWGNADDDNIVWGNTEDGNVVWGNSAADLSQPIPGDERADILSLPSSMWDAMFPLDATEPVTEVPPPPAPPSDEPPPTTDTTAVPPPTDTTVVPPPTDTTVVPPPTDTTVVPPPTDTTVVPPPTDTTVVPPPTDPVPTTDTTVVPPPTDPTVVPPPPPPGDGTLTGSTGGLL